MGPRVRIPSGAPLKQMIKNAMIKAMIKIANMSKKAALGYIINLTLQFFAAISLLLTGLIFIEADPVPDWALPLIIIGSIFVFTTTFTIMLATISSNYVERRLKKNSKKEDK